MIETQKYLNHYSDYRKINFTAALVKRESTNLTHPHLWQVIFTVT